MSNLKGTLEMAKQMRWREAHKATGSASCDHTKETIRLHNLVLALEATAAGGVPDQIFNTDIDGYPLDPSQPNY